MPVLQITGRGMVRQEEEVMSSSASLQLFSRCINMKQDADLKIDGRRGAENGEKKHKRGSLWALI